MRVALMLGLALVGVTAPPAHAQPRSDEARKLAADHFRKGQAAQKAGRYRDAIAEYEQAHELVPHPNTLFNIAVCYEKLGAWSDAAEYYERYLDEPGEHRDAATVQAKIDELRAKARPVTPAPVDEPSGGDPTSSSSGAPDPKTTVGSTSEPAGEPTESTSGPPGELTSGPVESSRSRWHFGFSYGIGFGDAPTERYLGFAGIQIAEQFEIDAILGKFGKNDLAIGMQGKWLLQRIGRFAPFGRGAITIGYAMQDASSTAESRFPTGLEAGGGILFGARGRFELSAVVRWTRGGFDMASTTADGYINDAFAFAIDLGFAFDTPRLPKTAGP